MDVAMCVRLSAAAVVFVGYVLTASTAHACDCFGAPTCANLWNAGLVFVGRVERIDTPSPRNEVATLVVEEWLRGAAVKDRVTIVSEGVGVACTYDFNEQRRYLVFAYQAPDGAWKAPLCGGTMPLESASKVLDEIKRDLRSRRSGRVSGSVAFDERPGELIFTGPPIPAATVSLRNEQRVLTTKTNARGEFQFPRVPPGAYSLFAALPADAQQVAPIPVRVGANACITRHVFPERANQSVVP
jgi:hypothetical protein